MSKAIHNLKIKLLSKVFSLSPEEEIQVELICEFTAVLYVKYWLQAPLPASAARLDLEFMAKVQHYRLTRPTIAFHVMQSVSRHLWYITPQLITLALADPGLEDSSKELMAKKLHSCERLEISTGKPTFPVLGQGTSEIRENLSSLISSKSWLVLSF